MTLFRILVPLALLPSLALFFASLILLSSNAEQAQLLAADRYGNAFAKAIASSIDQPLNAQSAQDLIPRLTHVVDSNPSLIAISLHDEKGTRLISVPQHPSSSDLLPFAADIPSSGTGHPPGIVRVFFNPASLPSSSLQETPNIILYVAFTAFVMVLALSVSIYANRSLASAVRAIRQLSLSSLKSSPPDNSLSTFPALNDAVQALASSYADNLQQERSDLATQLQEVEVQMASVMYREGQVRSLFSRVNEELEKERRSIAVDIHDQVNASAISIRNGSQAILDLSSAPAVGPEELNQISRYARQINLATEDIYASARAIVRNLRPEVLDLLGPTAAIKQMLDQYSDLHPSCQFQLADGADISWLKPDQALTVYRIIQEALNNVVKHSRASRLTVFFDEESDGSSVCIRIEDNGCGFNPPTSSNPSLGLVGMRERAIAIGARLEIQSERGSGTSIVLSIPRSISS